jgi:hypothetical protein
VLQIINSEIPAKPNIGGASLRASLSVTAVRGITATCRPVAGLDIKRPTISHSDLSSPAGFLHQLEQRRPIDVKNSRRLFLGKSLDRDAALNSDLLT